MYYIESGIPSVKSIYNIAPVTTQFRRRHKRKWSSMSSRILSVMGHENLPESWNIDSEAIKSQDEIRYRNCRSICRILYGKKEYKWISKHTFMLFSPLIQQGIKTENGKNVIRLPSSILRIIFVFLHGHGP